MMLRGKRPWLGMLLASFAGSALADASDAITCEEALARAEVAVAGARAREALWTTALEALRTARAARREADWKGCDTAAAQAGTLAGLGLRQLDYPPERE
jgi:hypothetical protein